MRKVQIAFVIFGVAYCSLIGWQAYKSNAAREALRCRMSAVEMRAGIR